MENVSLETGYPLFLDLASRPSAGFWLMFGFGKKLACLSWRNERGWRAGNYRR
ncbi:hypothetical protein [Dyella mobilis]|uniref:hypothetical protein n=1 Tax=Dyella mobilis TaxID=1849582 RepID=UPI0024E1092E|nr:hypothetical protein [Dyella mobilis]